MIRIDGEIYKTCDDCGEKSIIREMTIVGNSEARRISYETHSDSIVHSDHIEALHRAEHFYQIIFSLIDEFKRLNETERIVHLGDCAGIITELDFGSVRPSACNIRTIIIPYFTLKTFSKEYELRLEARDLSATKLVDLLSDAKKQAESIIKEAFERNKLGLL